MIMVNNVKPGYVNPLTMMGSNKNGQTKPLYSEGIQTPEKRKKILRSQKTIHSKFSVTYERNFW